MYTIFHGRAQEAGIIAYFDNSGIHYWQKDEESMPLPTHLLPTPVVGSYPQPDWLVDRAMLSKSVPRTRMEEMWRLPAEHLEEAQNDATIVAIRDMERAGIDIVTDGEIRRESYSNRFATALEGMDLDNPGTALDRTGHS